MALGALGARLRHGEHAAVLHVRGGGGHGLEAVLDLPAHQVGQQRAAALVRHVQRIDAALQLEHLQRQVLGRARAGGAEAHGAGRSLAGGDDVFHAEGLLARVGDEQVGRDAHEHDRHEVAFDAVAQLGLQAGCERVAVDVGHEQGAAVAGLLRHVVGREHAGDAGLVLDDDLLAPHRRELLRDHACQRVGAAAGWKAHHDAHGARGPLLCEQPGHAQRGGRAGGGLDQGTSLHLLCLRRLGNPMRAGSRLRGPGRVVGRRIVRAMRCGRCELACAGFRLLFAGRPVRPGGSRSSPLPPARRCPPA
ncbi:hypothetical protein D9M72_227880 [compost metagenome]